MRTVPFSRVARALLALAVLASPTAWALEDIDIYAGGSSAAAPNVLFYLDNSSNWSANSNAWSYSTVYGKCTTNYSDTTKRATCQQNVNLIFCPENSGSSCSSSASLVQGQVEIRALQLVLRLTNCNATGAKKLSYNVGLMLGGNASDAGSIADGASVGTSYIRHAIRPMSSQDCLTSAPSGGDLTKYLMADLTNIDSNITGSTFKTSSSFEYGSGFYEAFKYFGGWTNPAGAPGGTAGGATGVAGSPISDNAHFGPNRYSKVNPNEDGDAFTDGGKAIYKSPIASYGACGKNFIVLIGNTFPNQEFGTTQTASPPTNSVLQRVMSASGVTPAMSDPKQLISYASNEKSLIRFADEWADFLYKTDVSSATAKQNVMTYTVDVFNKQVSTDQTKLLQSIANAGLGTNDNHGYFSVGGDVQALIDALTDILTEIAGVNSVFASAALPVSVNTQGTYLNQVYIGLFRPDDQAQQRWYGNVKQYKFCVNTTNKTLYLCDASSPAKSAVDPTGGFIQNCAASYWTSDSKTGSLSAYWETITGTVSGCSTQTTSVYSDLPDGPIVERGGAAQKLRNLGHASRNLRTCSTGGCSSLVDFNATNVAISAGLQTVTMSNGTTTTTSTTTSDDLVNWVRGQNKGDGNTTNQGITTFTQYTKANADNVALDANSTRPTIHGEVVHGQPLAVNYGASGTSDVVIFYGAGDGVLRAIDGNQTGTTAGQELWGFIAPEHYSKLDRVHTNSPLVAYASVSGSISPTPQPKTYFFDGPITGYQDANPLTKLWVYAAMRRGGNMVYAFDAAKSGQKPSSTNQPTFLWKFGCASAGTGCGSATGESNMGQSWSPATVIRVKGITNPLVVFGGGYDACEDNDDSNAACASVTQGRGLYVMDAQLGSAANYRYISPAAAAHNTSAGTVNVTPGRFVAGIAAVDVDGDGNVDLLYAVDTRGNIWRINTSNPASAYAGYSNGVADWPAPQLVGVVSDWSTAAERRKFMYVPNVLVTSTSETLVLVGTGDREKPAATSSAAQVKNRFYGIKDSFKTTSNVTPAIGYGSVSQGTNLADLLNVTGLSSVDTTALATKKGWFLDLFTGTAPYEQVVTSPLTIGGVTYFNTYQAKSSTDSGSCTNLGTSRGYQVDFLTGAEKLNASGQLAPTTFANQGIAMSPVGGQVTVTDDSGNTRDYKFCMSCAGTMTLDSGATVGTNSTLSGLTVKVKPNPRRTQIYRYQKIDTK